MRSQKFWPGWRNNNAPPATAKPLAYPVVPAQPVWSFDWSKDAGQPPADLTWPSELFLELSLWQAAHPGEIAGYASADATGVIVWQYLSAIGHPSGVQTLAAAQMDALVAASERGLAVNVQWHTHFGFRPFFSETDDHAQHEYTRHLPAGEMVFAVFDQLSALTRRLAWDAAGVRGREGRVSVGGVTLPSGTFGAGVSYAYTTVLREDDYAARFVTASGPVPDEPTPGWDGPTHRGRPYPYRPLGDDDIATWRPWGD